MANAKHPLRPEDPTPEQIEIMCAEMRAGWSQAEKNKRNQLPAVKWGVYVIESRSIDWSCQGFE